MPSVSFIANGKKVSFKDSGKRKAARLKKHPPNAYARYVAKHIGAFLADGMSSTQAMKAVAKKYRASKK